MAYFILPPPQIMADSQEVPQSVLLQAKQYQKQLMSQLNISSSVFKVTKGAFVGTEIFNWNEKINGILMTSFVYEKGKGFQKEILKTATLLKQENCQHLGSLWNYTDKNKIPFTINQSLKNISDFPKRVFSNVSPVKINFQLQLQQKRFENFAQLIFVEGFSQKNIPLVSSGGRLYCKAEFDLSMKTQQITETPAKPHRLIELALNEMKKTKGPSKVTTRVEFHSGVFGQMKESLSEKNENSEFDLEKISLNLVEKTLPNLDKLNETEFKIVRRFGSWVYLNRGRAFGLKIGMRLKGPNKASLHIIRYAPKLEGELDSSIAFIRHESQESPLKLEDVVKLDPKIYP